MNLTMGLLSSKIHTGPEPILATRADESRIRLAFRSASVGAWDYDPATQTFEWDARCNELFGMPADAQVDYAAFLAALHPDDRERVDAAVRAALDPSSAGTYEIEHRVVSAGGDEVRWVDSKGEALFDDGRTRAVRFVGVMRDISIRKRAEAEREKTLAALSASEHQLRLALGAAQMGVWIWDIATQTLTWDPQLEEIHGMERGGFDGRFETFLEHMHPEDRDRAVAAIQGALQSETDEEFTLQVRVPFPDGSFRWVAGKGSVQRDAEGRPLRMMGMGWDVTRLKTAEEELRAKAEREALLNRIGQLLRSTTDPAQIQAHAVTALGEALAVDRCYFASYDAAHETAHIAGDWRRSDLAPFTGDWPLVQWGIKPQEIYPSDGVLVIDDLRACGFLPAETAATLERAGLRSAISVGLFEQGRIAASLFAAMADAPRAWTEHDMDLLKTVATQIRAATDAAQSRERERRIAERLQEALRPKIPATLPGLTLAEYYRTAFDDAEIGGDFYDVFSLKDSCHALVVADVSGKGLEAGAQIATVRHMLRALLYQEHVSLAKAVDFLNRMLVEHDLLDGFATLFVGVVDVNARTLTYASCGQEPGLIGRTKCGAAVELAPTGPILGAFASLRYQERTVHLCPGDVIAVFTDGLTEIGRTRGEMLGVDGVARILQQAITTSHNARSVANRLIAEVESLVPEGGIRDDICLLVARID